MQQPLAFYFALALELCQQKGGLQRGYLILDDVLIPRYSAGHLKLQRFKDLSSGAYTYGLALVVLAWTDGQTRLPHFGGEEASRLDLALSLLAWAETEGFKPEGVWFDAWYAAGEVLAWLHARGWPLVTGLRSNRHSAPLPLPGRILGWEGSRTAFRCTTWAIWVWWPASWTASGWCPWWRSG